MKRFLWLGFVLCLYLICSGCGETFRPIIIPNPPIFPNPRAAHTVISINDNGPVVPGTAMVIDVSGDTDISVRNVGTTPVHAVQQTASQVLVVNQAIVGTLGASITKLNFNSILIAGTSTITLPLNSAPNFIASTESVQAYVTMPSFTPPSIGVVNTQSNALTNTIPVGNNPVALAETPNALKLYVANEGDNTVSGFNVVDRSLRSVIPGFDSPVWLAERSDSQRLYVLNQGNGTVGTVDTTSTAGPDSLIGTTPAAPGAAYMLYDGNLNRLFIPGGSELAILDASPTVPTVINGTPVIIPPVGLSARATSSDPCASTTLPAGVNTVAVTTLPDGSRAYVGSYYEAVVQGVNTICPQVTVVDAVSNTVKSNIAIPGFAAFDAFCSTPTTRFRLTMASAGDSSRAYLGSCDGGNVSIIDTTTDTYVVNLPAPAGSRLNNPPQSPVFLLAGP
jgi:DNA-binding beta-propeller fold protein YncE